MEIGRKQWLSSKPVTVEMWWVAISQNVRFNMGLSVVLYWGISFGPYVYYVEGFDTWKNSVRVRRLTNGEKSRAARRKSCVTATEISLENSRKMWNFIPRVKMAIGRKKCFWNLMSSEAGTCGKIMTPEAKIKEFCSSSLKNVTGAGEENLRIYHSRENGNHSWMWVQFTVEIWWRVATSQKVRYILAKLKISKTQRSRHGPCLGN